MTALTQAQAPYQIQITQLTTSQITTAKPHAVQSNTKTREASAHSDLRYV